MGYPIKLIFVPRVDIHGPMNQETAIKHVVLADRLFPAGKTLVRDMMYVLLGSLFIAASSRISFYLPISPVPVTGLTFGVMLMGATLGAKRGALAVLAYIAEGVFGLPVFAGGVSGLAILKGITFGYILGCVFAAYWIGLMAEKGNERTFRSALPSFLQSYAIIFVLGVTWLSYFIGFPAALMKGFVVFIPGAILKLGLLSVMLPLAWKVAR